MLALPGSAEKLRRPVGAALVALGLGAVLWATLRHGDPASFQAVPVSCLVCGMAGGVDVWRNVVLFMPLGVGLGLLGVRPLRAALPGLLLSLFVETMQYTVFTGRTATLSDLVTNTAGAALGAFLAHRWHSWALPGVRQARWLTAAAAVAWVSVLALTGAGLRWSDERPPFRVNQLPPTRGAMRAFEGVVHEATMEGEPVASGSRATPVAPIAPGDTLRLRARVTPSYEPGMLRPLAWLHTQEWDEVLVFGQRHDALVVRLRTASADARFSSPSFILRGAFPEGRGEVELTAELTRDAVRLRSVSGEGTREATLGKSLDLGWLLLVPTNSLAHRMPRAAVSAVWLAALVAPLAFWGVRARAAPRLAALVALVVFTGGSLLLLTRLFELSPLAGAHWAGLGAGIAAGWGLGLATLGRGRERATRSIRRAA